MSDTLLVVESAIGVLALDVEAIEAARARAADLLPTMAPAAAAQAAPEPLLTAEALAAFLDVPRSQIESLARQGRIPSVPVGRYRRFARDAVLEALRRDQYTASTAVGVPRTFQNKRKTRVVAKESPDARA